jgi:glycosyltransferase involved in cell wall biosynthesis
MAVFPLLGIKIIPELVCVLWPRKKPQGYAARIVRRLDGWFFRWFPFAILSMSHEITAQVEELTGLHHPPIQEFLPTYRREDFANIDRPSYPRLSFRVLYVGRIERNKGVFALLDIARRFRAENRHEIIFDLCGTGSALEELRQLVKAEGLEERFRLHGQCCKPVMRQMFSESHMVVVPTTSDFVEGFNRVVAEGILSGRPVVTSDACPALEYVRDAVIEVPSDDVEAYGNAILLLCDDIELYEAKRIACLAVQSQFYDEERSWGAALKKSILLLGCPTSSTAPAGPSD